MSETRKLRRAVAGLAVTGAVALLLPVAVSGTATAASSSPASSAGEPSQAQWKALDTVVQSTSALGVFGTSNPVLVLPSDASAAAKVTAAADIPTGLQVPVKISQFTKDTLDKTIDAVSKNKWTQDKVNYNFGVSYDGTQDKVVVNTDAPAAVTASLKSAYGDKIQLVASRFQQQDRFNDHDPFLGGDSINGPGGPCTSGYSINATNPDDKRWDEMQTTAGHCYLDNQLVQNANGTNQGWIKLIGPADAAAFVGYGYWPQIWTGAYNGDNSNATVHSISGMYNGLNVCVSGQTSYIHCGHPITSTSYGYNWTDHNGQSHYTSPSDGFAYGPNGQGDLTQGGDSGAPVFVPLNGTQVAATGTHSGLLSWYDPDNCGCTQYRMYGVKIGSLMNDWGAQLMTNPN